MSGMQWQRVVTQMQRPIGFPSRCGTSDAAGYFDAKSNRCQGCNWSVSHRQVDPAEQYITTSELISVQMRRCYRTSRRETLHWLVSLPTPVPTQTKHCYRGFANSTRVPSGAKCRLIVFSCDPSLFFKSECPDSSMPGSEPRRTTSKIFDCKHARRSPSPALLVACHIGSKPSSVPLKATFRNLTTV